MKILHVIPSLKKGGAERLVLDICNELQTHTGIEVMLITFSADNDYKFMCEGLNWKIIPSKVIPSISGKAYVQVKELQQALDQFQPDIIHSHLFETEMVFSEIDTGKAKRIIHFHDNMKEFERTGPVLLLSKKKITNRYERKKVLKSYKNKSVLAVAISNDTSAYVSRNLPNWIQKTLLLNAINRERFLSTVKTKNEFRLVMIGSLVEKKGQQLALEVMAELNKRNIAARLDLLGEGIMRPQLEQYVETNDLTKSVQFHGNVNHPEKFLSTASIYLHTAKYEPFGLVILEAMAAGLPVICTDGKGNRELIVNGENGFIIYERSATQIANKIELLQQDENLRLKMGLFAQDFSAEFDIKIYTQKLLTLYREL